MATHIVNDRFEKSERLPGGGSPAPQALAVYSELSRDLPSAPGTARESLTIDSGPGTRISLLQPDGSIAPPKPVGCGTACGGCGGCDAPTSIAADAMNEGLRIKVAVNQNDAARSLGLFGSTSLTGGAEGVATLLALASTSALGAAMGNEVVRINARPEYPSTTASATSAGPLWDRIESRPERTSPSHHDAPSNTAPGQHGRADSPATTSSVTSSVTSTDTSADRGAAPKGFSSASAEREGPASERSHSINQSREVSHGGPSNHEIRPSGLPLATNPSPLVSAPIAPQLVSVSSSAVSPAPSLTPSPRVHQGGERTSETSTIRHPMPAREKERESTKQPPPSHIERASPIQMQRSTPTELKNSRVPVERTTRVVARHRTPLRSNDSQGAPLSSVRIESRIKQPSRQSPAASAHHVAEKHLARLLTAGKGTTNAATTTGAVRHTGIAQKASMRSPSSNVTLQRDLRSAPQRASVVRLERGMVRALTRLEQHPHSRLAHAALSRALTSLSKVGHALPLSPVTSGRFATSTAQLRAVVRALASGNLPAELKTRLVSVFKNTVAVALRLLRYTQGRNQERARPSTLRPPSKTERSRIRLRSASPSVHRMRTRRGALVRDHQSGPRATKSPRALMKRAALLQRRLNRTERHMQRLARVYEEQRTIMESYLALVRDQAQHTAQETRESRRRAQRLHRTLLRRKARALRVADGIDPLLSPSRKKATNTKKARSAQQDTKKNQTKLFVANSEAPKYELTTEMIREQNGSDLLSENDADREEDHLRGEER